MSLIERIAETFGKPKKGANGYLCKCPCHKDPSSSLILTEVKKPKAGECPVTFLCTAGCPPSDIYEIAKTLGVFEKPDKKKKKSLAGRDDYLFQIEKFFGECRRDIFSDDLLYYDKFAKLWTPTVNKIKALRSEIREEGAKSTKLYNTAEVEDHLYYLENSLQPRFVIDIPEWDGRDRLKELSERIILSDQQVSMGIEEGVFYELLKYWHCKMWQRLENPEIRNEIFILAGEQNIGKDFWIRENCEALGQYLVNFSIHTNERDTKEQLHRGLVMNISEFDRTSRTEVSLLKEVITATQTDLRFAYDRRAATRACRCSFIASTNVKDIFNDPTGHSRYIFFDIKMIDKSIRFTHDDKLQVLAQGRALAKAKFKPSAHALAIMASQIKELTPEDEYEIIIERWDYLCTELYNKASIVDKTRFTEIQGNKSYSGFLPNNITYEIIEKLGKEFSKSPKKIRSTLKLNLRQRVDENLGRGFYFKLVIPDQFNQAQSF